MAIAAIRIGLGAALILSVFPAFAAPDVVTAGGSGCSVSAYLNDPDPKGTNVRAAPSAKAPVIGQLPPRAKMEDGDEIVGVEFDVIGSKNGWLLVQNHDRGSFKGPGWVFGGLVSGTLGGSKLLATPADGAKVLATLQHAGETGIGPDSFEVMHVHGCQGPYVDVTIRLAPSIAPYPGLPKQPMRGWVRSMCSTQLTTCDPG
jgi:hypothetical protein